MAKQSIELPPPWPELPNGPAGLLAWCSAATGADIAATERAGDHEHGGLIVRLADGRELFFETVGEACRRERFITAFLTATSSPMPEWTGWQVRHIVAALMRAARLGQDADEREQFTDLGGRYLAGCLQAGGRIVQPLDVEHGVYLAASQLAVATKLLRGEHGERWPEVLHDPDACTLYFVRGLFQAYSRSVFGPMNRATLYQQMHRVGWTAVEWHPRQPGDWDGPRPHLRVWRVPDGWDGLWASASPLAAAIGRNHGPTGPNGPKSTRARAPGGANIRRTIRERGGHPGPLEP